MVDGLHARNNAVLRPATCRYGGQCAEARRVVVVNLPAERQSRGLVDIPAFTRSIGLYHRQALKTLLEHGGFVRVRVQQPRENAVVKPMRNGGGLQGFAQSRFLRCQRDGHSGQKELFRVATGLAQPLDPLFPSPYLPPGGARANRPPCNPSSRPSMTFGRPLGPTASVIVSTRSLGIPTDGHLRWVYSYQSSAEVIGSSCRSAANSPHVWAIGFGTSWPPIMATTPGIRGTLGSSLCSIHFRTSSEESCHVSSAMRSGRSSAARSSIILTKRKAPTALSVSGRKPVGRSNNRVVRIESIDGQPLQSARATCNPNPCAYSINSFARTVLPEPLSPFNNKTRSLLWPLIMRAKISNSSLRSASTRPCVGKAVGHKVGEWNASSPGLNRLQNVTTCCIEVAWTMPPMLLFESSRNAVRSNPTTRSLTNTGAPE